MTGEANLAATPGNPVPEAAVAGKITTLDGVELRFARWQGMPNGRGTVCVLGGRGEFIEKYFETIGELRRRGFAVATMDWRGQGQSARQLPDRRKGHVEDFSEYETDLSAFMQQVVLPDCPAPYFALTHSMGGAVVLRAAHSGKRWFERAVLVAPLIDFPGVRASLSMRLLFRMLQFAGLGRSYVPGGNMDRSRRRRFAGNPLTSDPRRFERNVAIVERFPTLGIAAPTVAWLNATFDTVAAFRAPDYVRQIDQPTLMLAAGADTVVSAAAIARFAARLPAGQCLTIEGARHEILQERDGYRAQVWAAFDAFIPVAST